LISQEDKDIYLFGIEIALLKFIHYSSMLIIGACFGMILHTIIFIVSYAVLREYAGGYHANTRMHCYLISWVIMISALLIIKLCPTKIMLWVSLFSLISAYILIFLMAPIGNTNKPLDPLEQDHYRALARIVATAETIIALLLLFINLQLSLTIALSLIFTSIMLILGSYKSTKQLIV